MSIIINLKSKKFKIDDEASLLYIMPTQTQIILFVGKYMVNGVLDQSIFGEPKKDDDSNDESVFTGNLNKQHEFMLDAAKQFLTNWEGFLDDDKNAIPFSYDLLHYIPFEALSNFVVEIVNPALEKAADKEEEDQGELKNSEST